jgi:hypothetical protein
MNDSKITLFEQSINKNYVRIFQPLMRFELDTNNIYILIDILVKKKP